MCPLQKGKIPPKRCIFDMTLHLMVELQLLSSGKYGVPLRWYYTPVHSDLEWQYLLWLYQKSKSTSLRFQALWSGLWHCWRSKDELISDVLLWTPTHGCARVGRPARTYIQQLCEDTGCNPEDLPEAMNDREKWRETVRDIRAGGATWWWWCISCRGAQPVLVQDIWGVGNNLSLPLLLDPLKPEVAVPALVESMGQIDHFKNGSVSIGLCAKKSLNKQLYKKGNKNIWCSWFPSLLSRNNPRQFDMLLKSIDQPNCLWWGAVFME